jgi:hypothetical protein
MGCQVFLCRSETGDVSNLGYEVQGFLRDVMK